MVGGAGAAGAARREAWSQRGRGQAGPGGVDGARGGACGGMRRETERLD